MYKVFVNDKPLFLTNHISKETDFQLFLLESIDIEQLIVKIFQNKIQKAYLYHPDEKEILKTLKEKIPVNKAGGGLVYNKKGEVLFIFRNGKWDLPKGGTNKGEAIEDTAAQLLKDNPKLKSDLEAKKQKEPEFLNNPKAQLDWIYKQSMYYEKAHLNYPVFRITK